MQSNKDSNGGKSHPTRKHSGNKGDAKSDDKKGAAASPVGSPKPGQKKTTPH